MYGDANTTCSMRTRFVRCATFLVRVRNPPWWDRRDSNPQCFSALGYEPREFTNYSTVPNIHFFLNSSPLTVITFRPRR